MELDGYAVGGLAVESHAEMYSMLEETVPYLRKQANLPDGVGTPANILKQVERGIDFDCVYPSRNGRHGHVYANQGS